MILPKPRLQIYDDDAARNALCSDTMFYVTIFFTARVKIRSGFLKIKMDLAVGARQSAESVLRVASFKLEATFFASS